MRLPDRGIDVSELVLLLFSTRKYCQTNQHQLQQQQHIRRKMDKFVVLAEAQKCSLILDCTLVFVFIALRATFWRREGGEQNGKLNLNNTLHNERHLKKGAFSPPPFVHKDVCVMDGKFWK